MRFRGGGVGHTSTRTATDRFLKDRDQLDRDNGPTQGGDDPDEIEDGFNGSTLPSPTVSERNRAVPSGSECFRVFPIIFQLSSECFRAVLSNSERFRSFPIYFIKKLKVHF